MLGQTDTLSEQQDMLRLTDFVRETTTTTSTSTGHATGSVETKRCTCSTCKVTFSNSYDECYGRMMKLCKNMCDERPELDLGPPLDLYARDNLIRKCISTTNTCEFSSDLIMLHVTQEIGLFDMLTRLGHHLSTCNLDVYARYLHKVNHQWVYVLWNEITCHLIDIHFKPSQNGLKHLEQIIENMHSRQHMLNGLETELLENICEIFTYCEHVVPVLYSKLYKFIEFTDELDAIPTMKNTSKYLFKIRQEHGSISFPEFDTDLERWKEEGVLDDLGIHRVRKLVFFKLRLNACPTSENLFDQLYCQYVAGDSPLKKMLVYVFELYHTTHNWKSNELKELLFANNLSFSSSKKWECVALNIRVLNIMNEDNSSEMMNNFVNCLSYFNLEEQNGGFSMCILEILEFIKTHVNTFAKQQEELLVEVINLFSNHLDSEGSCASLEDDQCSSMIEFAEFTSKMSFPYQRLTKMLTRAFEREMLKPNRQKLIEIFEFHWFNRLDTIENARNLRIQFENAQLWDTLLKTQVTEMSHKRIQIVNELILNSQLFNIFIPNSSEQDHLRYIGAIVCYPFVSVYSKDNEKTQDLIKFSYVANRVLESVENQLISDTLPINLQSISIFFSKVALYYCKDVSSDQDLEHYKYMMNTILMTSKPFDYCREAILVIQIFMRGNMIIHSSKHGILRFAIGRLFNMIQHIMEHQSSQTFDFSSQLNFYQNHPLVRNSHLLSLLLDLQLKHQAIKK